MPDGRRRHHRWPPGQLAGQGFIRRGFTYTSRFSILLERRSMRLLSAKLIGDPADGATQVAQHFHGRVARRSCTAGIPQNRA